MSLKHGRPEGFGSTLSALTAEAASRAMVLRIGGTRMLEGRVEVR